MKDIKVLDIDSEGKITVNANKGSSVVSGKKALAQQVALNLLNIRGSNAYTPNKGSSVQQLTGGNFTQGDEEALKTLIIMAVNEIEEAIIAEQVTLSGLKADERLKNLKVSSIKYEESNDAWLVQILLVTESGGELLLEV